MKGKKSFLIILLISTVIMYAGCSGTADKVSQSEVTSTVDSMRQSEATSSADTANKDTANEDTVNIDTVNIDTVDMDSAKIVLTNCIVIDGTGSSPMENRVIFIRDGIIERIETEENAILSDEYTRVDLQNRVVLPGFINTHVHCFGSEATLENWLRNGVTTVRELASREGVDFAGSRDRLNQNNKLARMLTATPILTKPGGYIPPFDSPVNSPEEASQKTKEYLKMKPDVVKIAIEDDLQGRSWKMLSLEEIQSITKAAHEENIRVAVHISHKRNLHLAIDGGVDELSHMVVEPLDNETVKRIVEKNMYWVPTLELWKGVSGRYGLDWTGIAIQNLAMFYKAGGKIALGTDYGGHPTPFDQGMPVTEMQLMQQAGMTNMDIIVAATKNAAVLCGMEEQLGTLEAGKIADIIVADGDPLSSLEVLENLHMVIHNGKIVVSQ